MYIRQFLRTWRIFGGKPFGEIYGGWMLGAVEMEQNITIPYTSGVAMTFDASKGNNFTLTVTDGVAYTINAPTNPPPAGFSQELSLTIRNTSGGALGAATFNAVFKMPAWVNPATGNSRSIQWQWNGTNWIEAFRSAADVPN